MKPLFFKLNQLLLLGLVFSLAACGGQSGPSAVSGSDSTLTASEAGGGGNSANPVNIQVLSNRSDLISGGDALVAVTTADSALLDKAKITLGDQDITSEFQKDNQGRLVALVSGLALGENTLKAVVPGAGVGVANLVNHPAGGPIFAGPQLMPWKCRNSEAIDAQCNQPAQYTYVYKSTDQTKSGLQPYDPANPPTDVADTTTDQGVTVPFIVRVETGYIDRDQYKIAVLYQPNQPWTVTSPQPQFNHKLVINHGFSCGVEYQTGTAPTVAPDGNQSIPAVGGSLPASTFGVDILQDASLYALGKGFAVMSNALDYSGHNCNIAVQAESLVMTKERVIEQYGELRYTIGEGCSGGSLAEQWISNAYPGVYQGILPTCSFPDAWSTATQFADYHLTLNYFTNPNMWGQGVVWSPTQMAAVQGHISIVNSEVSDNAQYHVARPTDTCGGISDSERYDPQNNPGGVRCDVQDAAINLLGPRPQKIWGPQEQAVGKGFAGFPLDNVGVQYGLTALQQGLITPDQFLDLNKKIGGVNQDADVINSRFEAVQPALANAYRTGLINEGNNMNQTAVIDCRGPDPGAFHDAYRAFAMRARLDREHGNHDNQLIWEGPVPLFGDNSCALNSFIAMDRWLSAVEQDTANLPVATKIAKDKPADLKDACFDGAGHKIKDGICGEAVVPVYGTPRTVAGDAISTDTNKCQLKPLNRTDNYGLVPFTDAQWTEMQSIFPEGVCDFSKPGVSQQGTIAWQSYGTANSVIYGGKAMPSAPANSGSGWASGSFGVFRQ